MIQIQQTVSAVIRRGGEVLLVLGRGVTDPSPHWELPGGNVGLYELPAEALSREVYEETGLEVLDPGHLVASVRVLEGESSRPGFPASMASSLYEVTSWRGEVRTADTGEPVREARFVPIAEAIRVLEEDLPWPHPRESILAYLRGEAAPGALWLYRRQRDGTDELVGRLEDTRRGRARSNGEQPTNGHSSHMEDADGDSSS